MFLYLRMFRVIYGYLLSALVSLVQHIVEHDWLLDITGMYGQRLDQMLLCKSLETDLWSPVCLLLKAGNLTHLLADISRLRIGGSGRSNILSFLHLN